MQRVAVHLSLTWCWGPGWQPSPWQRDPEGSLVKKLRHKLSRTPEQSSVFTGQLYLPRVWISPAILCWALGTSTLTLNNPPTIPVLPSASLLWAPAGALHLFCGFPLLLQSFSGSCVGSPESGNLESRGDVCLCHCLEVFMDKCSMETEA